MYSDLINSHNAVIITLTYILIEETGINLPYKPKF